MLKKSSDTISKRAKIQKLRAKAAKMADAKDIVNPPPNEKKHNKSAKHFDNANLMKERGRAIRYLREMNGLTMEEFCLVVNVSRTYLSLIENGRRTPSIDLMDYWLDILGGRLMVIPVGKE